MEGLDAMKISEEKKKYIVELLNPMLEEMVAECIHKMPNDPVPFMLEWLEQKKVTDEDKLLSPEEKQRLKEENKKLQDNMAKVKGEMQEAAKMVSSKDDNEPADSDEDEEDDEPPPDFFKEKNTKARGSVSAEAFGEWNTKKAFVAPVIAKSDEQKERLKNRLSESFMFASLDDQDLTIVIGAMKEVIVEPKQRVITQGEDGEFLFVIESGKLDCIIKIDGADKTVKTCEAGDHFGELALLYNCPRAASVEAQEKCVLWQLDRDTFTNIVKEAAQKKRQRYDTFLAKVPLLASMDAYERSQLADALKPETVVDGGAICKQGEPGNKFYIIEEGEAVATKGDQQVMSYSSGDYFGELALIRNQPRAATVSAKGTCRLLSIESKAFKRLLNVQDLLERSNRYT
jgi:cAMP-dependent protein kinase regulator